MHNQGFEHFVKAERDQPYSPASDLLCPKLPSSPSRRGCAPWLANRESEHTWNIAIRGPLALTEEFTRWLPVTMAACKETSPKAAETASRTLRDDRTAEASKTAAGSALSQDGALTFQTPTTLTPNACAPSASRASSVASAWPPSAATARWSASLPRKPVAGISQYRAARAKAGWGTGSRVNWSAILARHSARIWDCRSAGRTPRRSLIPSALENSVTTQSLMHSVPSPCSASHA